MATYSPEQFERKIKAWAKNTPEAVERGLKAGAELVRAEAVLNHLSGPKMPKGKGSLKNATLQPRTGDLRGSINTKVKTSPKISAQVGTSIKYARRHEEGIKMPKRPFLKPSLEAKRDKAVELILDKIMEAYRKS